MHFLIKIVLISFKKAESLPNIRYFGNLFVFSLKIMVNIYIFTIALKFIIFFVIQDSAETIEIFL